MTNKRNLSIIGSPNSGVSEVFAAILRHGITPPAPENGAILDGPTDWTDLVPPPYDAKKRKRGLGSKE